MLIGKSLVSPSFLRILVTTLLYMSVRKMDPYPLYLKGFGV